MIPELADRPIALPAGYELTTTVAPAVEPVTVAEAKLNARVDHSAEDSLWAIWVAAARRLTEREANRRWVTQTVKLVLPGWPADGMIRLPVAPVQSVTSVKYYDATGTQQTLTASTDYRAWLGHHRPVIYPPPPAYWPDLTDSRLDAVEVIFVAGYGAAADVPPEARQAVLLATAYWAENRGDQDAPGAMGLPAGAVRLCRMLDAEGYR